MTTALALIQPTEYDLISKLAAVAAQSGYVGKSEAQAFFIMLKGHELGISPMQALDGIQIIQGKPTVSPQLMLALINRSGELQDIQIDSSPTACTVKMTRKGRSPHTESFTLQNAQAMGLAGKDNYKKQPAVMLKWRAVSACARIVFPDIIQGMYTPEEMGAETSENDNGDIVIEQPTLELVKPETVNEATGEITEGEIITENTPQSNEKAVSSDLATSNQADVTATETPRKNPFMGNGQQERRIPPKSDDMADVWPYDLSQLMAHPDLQDIKPYQHRKNAIEEQYKAGNLNACTNISDAVKVILNRNAALDKAV